MSSPHSFRLVSLRTNFAPAESMPARIDETLARIAKSILRSRPRSADRKRDRRCRGFVRALAHGPRSRRSTAFLLRSRRHRTAEQSPGQARPWSRSGDSRDSAIVHLSRASRSSSSRRTTNSLPPPVAPDPNPHRNATPALFERLGPAVASAWCRRHWGPRVGSPSAIELLGATLQPTSARSTAAARMITSAKAARARSARRWPTPGWCCAPSPTAPAAIPASSGFKVMRFSPGGLRHVWAFSKPAAGASRAKAHGRRLPRRRRASPDWHRLKGAPKIPHRDVEQAMRAQSLTQSLHLLVRRCR